jgi:nucleoside-diphosphate-sugar epimerase
MLNMLSKILNEEQLEVNLSRPLPETIEVFNNLDGDIIFLGIAGKIGPSLARMAKRSCDEAGVKKRIIGVSRFSNLKEKELIESLGIETVQGDLLDNDFISELPLVKNVFYLTGMKFGSRENLSMTWAVNSYIPAMVAEHYKQSRIVAYSTGCIYPLVSISSGGSVETDTPEPIGEYAQSCLGRERMFEFGSKKYKTPVALIRLNYAVELRYGVLVDIAIKVKNKLPVDLSMGYFNAIWQGDANNYVLRSLLHTESPAKILNIAGEETLSVREIALKFAKLFNTQINFVGKEADTALLSNSNLVFNLFGKPTVSTDEMVHWIANWLMENKKLLDKPTHFEVRDGKY